MGDSYVKNDLSLEKLDLSIANEDSSVITEAQKSSIRLIKATFGA